MALKEVNLTYMCPRNLVQEPDSETDGCSYLNVSLFQLFTFGQKETYIDFLSRFHYSIAKE
jgi:hypothetical protein